MAPVSLAGSAPLCPPPVQQQPFPAAWAPPQAPPAGLQRAPCGCCFDPRVFSVQWTIPYNHQGTAVAAATPVLPSQGYQQLERQFAHLSVSSKVTAAGTPLGGHVPPSCSAATPNKAAGDPTSHLAVPDKILLEDALKLFGCSMDKEWVSKEDPKPDEPGVAIAAMPQQDFSSLALPEDLLTPDYSVPEIRAAVLSMEEFYILGTEPPELWGAGIELPRCQADPAEQRGCERRHKAGHSP
ncbi:hypothetical protein Q9233_017147 [Columba guinea]|nr:hypothetical protein Q9233_017147 [Columba guinea]